jgi:hypothetical protein
VRLGLLLGTALALLAACADWNHARSTTTVTVDRDYEGLYRSILEDARRCYPPKVGAEPREVEGSLDTQARTGKVMFAYGTRDDRQTFMTADVRALSAGSSKVTIEAKPGSEAHAGMLRRWVDGTSNECLQP